MRKIVQSENSVRYSEQLLKNRSAWNQADRKIHPGQCRLSEAQVEQGRIPDWPVLRTTGWALHYIRNHCFSLLQNSSKKKSGSLSKSHLLPDSIREYNLLLKMLSDRGSRSFRTIFRILKDIPCLKIPVTCLYLHCHITKYRLSIPVFRILRCFSNSSPEKGSSPKDEPDCILDCNALPISALLP